MELYLWPSEQYTHYNVHSMLTKILSVIQHGVREINPTCAIGKVCTTFPVITIPKFTPIYWDLLLANSKIVNPSFSPFTTNWNVKTVSEPKNV